MIGSDLHRRILRDLEEGGLTDVTVRSYSRAWSATVIEMSGVVVDGYRVGYKIIISDLAWQSGDGHRIVSYGIRQLLRRAKNLGRINVIDAVAFAADLVGFTPDEIETAKFRVEGFHVVLDVDLRDSSWEPTYNVSQLDLELWDIALRRRAIVAAW